MGNSNNSMSSEGEEEGVPHFVVAKYGQLIEKLRSNTCPELAITSVELMELILESIDEFCAALATVQGIVFVKLRCEDFSRGRKLDTSNKAAAWTQFCQAIKNLGAVEEFVIEDELMFKMPAVVEVLQNLPATRKLRVSLDCKDVESVLNELKQAISSPNMTKVSLKLHDSVHWQRCILSQTGCVISQLLANGHTMPANEDVASDLYDRQSELSPRGTTVSTLLNAVNAGSLYELKLFYVHLSLVDCMALASLLASDASIIEELGLFECMFPDQGGLAIAQAISSSKSLSVVSLEGSFRNEGYRNAVLSSLPKSTSIKTLNIASDESGFPGKTTYLKRLVLSVVSENKSIKNLIFLDKMTKISSPVSDYATSSELAQALQQNKSLESISGHDADSPCHAILRLNNAGRRYLEDDGSSRSRCIAVLAKVKDDLDCLFFHMRENPILCFNDETSDHDTGTKRLADVTLKGAAPTSKGS